MTKSERVHEQLKELTSRVTLLTESRKRMDIFDGMNDGKILTDTGKRIEAAEIRLSDFIEANLEYII